MSDLPPTEAARLHLDALYERDATGLLVRPRGTGPVPAPRLHLVRTVEGNHWLFSAVLDQDVRDRIETLLAAEPVLRHLDAAEARPPACREAVIAALGGRRPVVEHRGPAFLFPAVLPPPDRPVETLRTPAEADPHPGLVWLSAFEEVDRPLVVARGAQGEAVACCHAARTGPEAAEAGLDVVEPYRRHGLAVAVTLGWAMAVRSDGRLPLYSTTWGNHASRGVARRLGLRAYAEDWHVT